ncbi:MAG: hypothetical protein ACTSXC_08335 [Candidatus Freyarchaeota archaeon]
MLRKITAGKNPQEENRRRRHSLGGKREERGMRVDSNARGKLAIPLEIAFLCIKI